MEYYNYFSTKEFEAANFYQGDDLGAVWTKEETRFRVWAPTAEQVLLNLYKTGDKEDQFNCIAMVKDVNGTWTITLKSDQSGKPVHVPEGEWRVYVKGNRAGTEVLETNTGGVVYIEPISAMVMIRQ